MPVNPLRSAAPRRCLTLLFALVLAGCARTPPPADADVIVVGAGIAGLAAALEAAAEGASVLVIEANSVGGGHAVKAGGFALVATRLQREKGISDNPQLALADWMRRGEDPDVYWASRYAEESATEVYDWLDALGVEFHMVLPTPEDTVPRFHFTRGTAVNAVVPMLQRALLEGRIRFVMNTRVTALARLGNAIVGVSGTNERDGSKRVYRARSVVLATGGFEGDLERVHERWPAGRERPPRLLIGAGHYALGDGYRMTEWAGARFRNPDRQVIFYTGLPNPRDPTGQRGLYAQNPAAIWVDRAGRRFIDETVDDKTLDEFMRERANAGLWMIFDSRGARRFSLRDAPWLTSELVRSEILTDPELVVRADSVTELARRAGLPVHGLTATVQTFNRMLEVGEDFQFGRFAPERPDRLARAVAEPPFYAVRLYPLTRKSLGGPAIDRNGRVLDKNGRPIPGLFAAGELTGVAGINGRYGGAGTFLGPSVLTGRVAGRAAAASRGTAVLSAPAAPRTVATPTQPGQAGFWHYDVAHALVAERGYDCSRCHGDPATMQPSPTRAAMLQRLTTCTTCH